VVGASPGLSSFPKSWSYAGGEVALRLRPHPRARRLALRIDATGEAVELIVPRRGSQNDALRFLEANRPWVEKRLAALPPRTIFIDGAIIPLFDVPHLVRHAGKTHGKGPVWIEAGAICVTGDPAFLARRLRDFLRDFAKRELTRRAQSVAASIGQTVKRVSVRDTTTRWGSCARTGNLSFSWRLIFAPEAVLDYVVAHEVAHLVEMNHGVRFWRLVARLHPDPKPQRLWLNRNRARLLRIG
jgi:predicted metal-dependent hydrolase